MATRIFALAAFAAALLVPSIPVCGAAPAKWDWSTSPDRHWPGSDWVVNRVQDWRVRDGALVVVDAGDAAGHAGQQIGAVALAEPGLQHVSVHAVVQKLQVGDFVAAKPVILDVQAGHGSLTRQR